VLNRNVAAIRRERGVPHINHPNLGWALTRDELQQVRDNRLFEIYNGRPLVNNEGGGVPGLEEALDTILSNGILLYGLAVDDAHTFKQWRRPHHSHKSDVTIGSPNAGARGLMSRALAPPRRLRNPARRPAGTSGGAGLPRR
jgi:hypothetical protein